MHRKLPLYTITKLAINRSEMIMQGMTCRKEFNGQCRSWLPAVIAGPIPAIR